MHDINRPVLNTGSGKEDSAKPDLGCRRWAMILWIAVALSWTLAGAASAQKPSGLQPPSNEHIAMVRMWRLVSALEIDEAQAMKVFPAFSQHQRARDELVSRGQEMRVSLRQQLANKDDDEKLLAQMAQIRTVDGEITTLERDFEKRLSNVLTARQQARLMLFEDTFRTDLQGMVRRMRGMGERGPGTDGAARRRWGESR